MTDPSNQHGRTVSKSPLRRQQEIELRERSVAAVLVAAVEEAEAVGLMAMTRDGVAARAGLSPGTVSNCYNGMDGLRRRVVLEAVERKLYKLMGQAVASATWADLVPADLKGPALAALA